jgi:hypothetical protein
VTVVEVLAELFVSSKTGSGNPNTALSPLLTIRSPNRAITSLALLVTRGSFESLLIKGTNLVIVFAASVAVFELAEDRDDAPLVPNKRPIFQARCMAGVLEYRMKVQV